MALFILFVFIVICAVFLLVVFQNTDLVQLYFLAYSTPRMYVGLVLLASLIAGMALMYLLSLFRAMRHQLIIFGTRRQVRKHESSIGELQAQLSKAREEISVLREQLALAGGAPVTTGEPAELPPGSPPPERKNSRTT